MFHWLQAHLDRLLPFLGIFSALRLVNGALRRMQAARQAPPPANRPPVDPEPVVQAGN